MPIQGGDEKEVVTLDNICEEDVDGVESRMADFDSWLEEELGDIRFRFWYAVWGVLLRLWGFVYRAWDRFLFWLWLKFECQWFWRNDSG